MQSSGKYCKRNSQHIEQEQIEKKMSDEDGQKVKKQKTVSAFNFYLQHKKSHLLLFSHRFGSS